MNDLLKLSALTLARRIRTGQLTSVDLTEACLKRIEDINPSINAFVLVDREGALETARKVDELVAAGQTDDFTPLTGVPVAIKDNMVKHGQETTCCSKILKGWKPPYDATVVVKLNEARLPIIGRTNMDEFAMGSTTQFSCYGPTHNPWKHGRIPGGSGGGSAAAVGAYMVPLALGSDTGGSIRQPGAVTGTVGAKPTYGYVSRYGLVAMASSLDQIGPVTRTVADAAALQDIVGGHDPKDSTSLDDCAYGLLDVVEGGRANGNEDSRADGDEDARAHGNEDAPETGALAGLRVGVVKELTGEGFADDVVDVFKDTVAKLEAAGATVTEVSCPTFRYALAAYYLIMPAEVSSNLARFDGIRFGIRVEPEEGPVTAETVMAATRAAGFGDEVKRRIILGTHVLSSGYYDAYYGSAQKVRTLVQRDFASAFEGVDVLVSPTSPTTAFKLGDNLDDPLTMYACDLATIPANLCGVPAMSVPVGLSAKDGLPVGFQVIAPARRDDVMYRAAAAVMDVIDNDITASCPVDLGKDA